MAKSRIQRHDVAEISPSECPREVPSSLSDLGMTFLSDRALVVGKRLKNHFRGCVDSVDLSSPGPDS